MIEEVLNKHGFKVGNAQPPYFVFVFPDYILQSELPRCYKVPKFLTFAVELQESIVKYVAYFQTKCGDLTIDEFLKMKIFPSSLMKNDFTWFTTLPPNSMYAWAQLKRVFHEHFFSGETKVSLIDMKTTKCFSNETIEYYLNRFQQMEARCHTQILEYELVRIVVVGLNFSI